MADKTAIAWCDHTQNWWLGCFKVSLGCRNCYADELSRTRMGIDVFGADTSKRRRTGAKVWAQPAKWNREAFAKLHRPARVFSLSMGDFFEDAPELNAWRREAWGIIRNTTNLDWLLLTKRPENIAKMLPDDWSSSWLAQATGRDHWPHVWLGTSVEDNRVVDRVPLLTAVPAHVHFISYEPAIGPGDEIPLEHVEWLIQGGESGPGYRPMDIAWAFDMWSRCASRGIPYFFKQSAARRTEMGIDALGQVVREYPQSWDRGELRRAAA